MIRVSTILLLIGLASITKGVMAQSPVTHQRVFDTIPFIMEHHNNRIATFNSEPFAINEVVFLGNSITEGGKWAELTGLKNTLNRGIGGDITYGLLNRLDEVIIRKPDKLFVLIGINDLGKDIPEAVIANNVKKLIKRVKENSPGTTIYIQSILPVNPDYPGFPQHYDKQDHVLMANQLLYKVCNDEGITFINLFPYFLDKYHRLDAELTNDGLHLNEKGYELWVNLLKKWNYLK